MRIGIVGATGAVGMELLAVLAERKLRVSELRLFASSRSTGRVIDSRVAGPVVVEALDPDRLGGLDIVFFSAGAEISRRLARGAAASGAWVIDNSSAFRMAADVPLVVPEVNLSSISAGTRLIANPNCSAIIMAVALWPLHQVARARRVVVSTYQAASGAGARALAELEEQTRAALDGESLRPSIFPEPCAFNVFSHNSPVSENGFNGEELKMIAETRRIFDDPSIQIAPTCMRVPVRRAHTEAISVEFERPIDEIMARDLLSAAPGVRVVDDRPANRFPTPLRASDQDDVLVGRIRQDPTVPQLRGLQFICAGDQLRKGAASNAVQIAEHLVSRELRES